MQDMDDTDQFYYEMHSQASIPSNIPVEGDRKSKENEENEERAKKKNEKLVRVKNSLC